MSQGVILQGNRVVIDFDPFTGMFKGTFLDLRLSPFYGNSLEELKQAGLKALSQLELA